MPIDPQVIAHYEAKRAATSTSQAFSTVEEAVAALRANADELYNDKRQFPPVFSVTDASVPCFWGDMPIRIYSPGDKGPYPILIYYHGGGFMIHNIASHDGICRKLCLEAEATVVSVGYRLTPEVKVSDCLVDSYMALDWVYDNAHTFGGDKTRIAVAGDSAGSMISASVALLARDRKGPKIGLQILIYGTGCGLSEEESESFRTLIDHNYVLNRGFMAVTEQAGRGGDAGVSEIYMNPGRCKDLSGMPKTFSLNAEYDPLRDDGEEYARRLKEAGNEVISWRVPGMMHGFLLLWEKFDTSAFAMQEIARVFKETFAK
ncbi:MAG: alpha/beta hydrolase [Clostridiales bacterium]|nr:alpha/beta hydrolase [Clostridiales bacterium]